MPCCNCYPRNPTTAYRDFLSDLGDDILLEGGADIVFRMETQERANLLETLESTGDTDGMCICQFEAAMGN